MVLESHVFKPFKQYAPGFGCRGICERSELTTIPKRHRGYTCQEEGIKYCKRCAVYFKPEAGIYCPCCKLRLKLRGRSKQARAFREQQRILREYNNCVEGKYFWYSCDGCDFDTPSYIQSFFHKKETGHQRTIKEVDISFIQNLVQRLGKVQEKKKEDIQVQ